MVDPETQIVEHHAEDIFEHEQKPGDTIFALVFFMGSLYLLSQIGAQTKWVKGVNTMMQPRLWPLISLLGMTVFGLGHLIVSRQVQAKKVINKLILRDELFIWVKPVEYALYFLLYVYLVPMLGYLPATVLFSVFLCLRTGYRQIRMILAAVLVAMGTVLLFKTFLQVKIPGGQLYDWFPEPVRNILIIYF